MSSRARVCQGAHVGREPGKERISLEECRNLAGPHCGLSDAELLQLRDQMYNFGEVIVSLMPKPAVWESIDERAAIMEFDGGQSHQAAEREAVARHIKDRP
jgi:hypothetical protein